MRAGARPGPAAWKAVGAWWCQPPGWGAREGSRAGWGASEIRRQRRRLECGLSVECTVPGSWGSLGWRLSHPPAPGRLAPPEQVCALSAGRPLLWAGTSAMQGAQLREASRTWLVCPRGRQGLPRGRCSQLYPRGSGRCSPGWACLLLPTAPRLPTSRLPLRPPVCTLQLQPFPEDEDGRSSGARDRLLLLCLL